MSVPKLPRKAFVDPVVSEPIDALDATRSFGGLLGLPLPGSNAGAQDDGDNYYGYSYYTDSPCQDGTDPCGPPT